MIEQHHIIRPQGQPNREQRDWNLWLAVIKHPGSRFPQLIPSDVKNIKFSEFERRFYTKWIARSDAWTIDRDTRQPVLAWGYLEKKYWDSFQNWWWQEVAVKKYIRAVDLLKALWEGNPNYIQSPDMIMTHFIKENWVSNSKKDKHNVLDCADCHDDLMVVVDRICHQYQIDHYDVWGCANSPDESVGNKLYTAGIIKTSGAQLKLF